jgi:Glycosyltransferases involved in cell wall biogenesis
MDGSGTADVSVVLPAYDEEDTIETTVRTTIETLEEFLRPDTFEVLIAEDGCTDQTPAIADQLAQADSRVQHFHSDERLGRGGALERAFEAATGERSRISTRTWRQICNIWSDSSRQFSLARLTSPRAPAGSRVNGPSARANEGFLREGSTCSSVVFWARIS